MVHIEDKLGYTFSDETLILTAFTHSSYANEKHTLSNERLEFLGDSILGMVTATHLYNRFPDQPEGFLTKTRAELVCEQSLWAIADNLDFGHNLLLGRGEENTGGRQRHSILADCVEAVIAAIYLDGGLAPAQSFIEKHVLSKLDSPIDELPSDYKTGLQEYIQQKPGRSLYYNLIGEKGPDHNKVFCCAALLDGSEIGRGEGKTKKEAEQNAAKNALEVLKEKKSEKI